MLISFPDIPQPWRTQVQPLEDILFHSLLRIYEQQFAELPLRALCDSYLAIVVPPAVSAKTVAASIEMAAKATLIVQRAAAQLSDVDKEIEKIVQEWNQDGVILTVLQKILAEKQYLRTTNSFSFV